MPQLTLALNHKKLNFDFTPGECVLAILKTADVKIGSACACHGFCGLCRIKVSKGSEEQLTAIEHSKLSVQQIQQGIRLACQLKPTADLTIAIENPLNVLKWRVVHRLNKAMLCADDAYGIALDLGTTHLRLSLWNISRQQRVISWQTFNPQFRFGSDVLTRLIAAKDSVADALELQLLIQQVLKKILPPINQLLPAITQLKTILIVGNSAMLALVSHQNYQQLLEPEYWTQPIECQIEDVSAWQQFLGVNSTTQLTIVPPVAGFIGSDLLVGVLATDLTQTRECALLIDFGTNSEMALWDGEKLWISSVPGGPAFEGSGMSCGMPAEAGAICNMQLAGNVWDYQVIGHGEGLGLCGSGLVDVIAQLLESGELNCNGRFKNAVDEYLLTLSTGKSLTIRKHDIDIFQRAKAATGAAIVQLLTASAIALSDLKQVCVCGAFGQFLNTEHAQAIGLLPPIELKRIRLCENTALSGCELLLSSKQNDALMTELRSKIQLVNMAHALDFDDCFVENLYLRPIKANYHC